MRNQWGLGLHFIFVIIFLVASTHTCLGARNRNIMVACSEHERLALLKFKHSVRYDNDILSSWVGNNCCQWERVTCDSLTGRVESLHLRGGSILFVARSSFEYIVELRHLKYLDLSGNDFQGSQIPEIIGSLKQLTYLNLSHAYFYGIIPHQIGNISNLMNLDLSHQQLVVDDITWISGLSSLEHLDLSFVNLSGAKNLDMVLYMLPLLKELSLSGCDLSNVNLGPLRNSSSVSHIRHLDLSWNYFRGQLPHFFQNMTSLQFLDLSTFSFSPTWNFANFLSMFPSILDLRLSACNLKETHLSHTHNFTTLSNLQHLDLSYNELTGPIPTFPGKLTQLHLRWNQLNGSIPQSLGKLRLLQVLELSHNELTDLIPESLGKLRLLQVLDLSHNELTGLMPESLGKLRLLQVLDLSNNKLTGLIPESFARLAALTTFSLGDNQLSGTIPVSIGQLSKLRSLDVSSNSLQGVVSESHFANLSMLEYLNTAYNSKLTFNVSREWLPPFQLMTLDLSFCKIENGFPQWLHNQRKLHSLELSNSNISGPLPAWLRKMPIICIINLSHNNLSGCMTNLPSGGTDLCFGYSLLSLQNNLFNESIPRSLCKRKHLDELDLSKNKVTGKIPNCFKNLRKLLVLILSSNRLSGVIPSFIGNISSLIWIKLNDNIFSGELPKEFWNLSQLQVLDLGDNAFCGKIPEWIGERVKSLRVFRLHNNNFSGGIPRSLCTNAYLRILDVARNNLTGTIHHCLGQLEGMAYNNEPMPDYNDTEEGVIQVMKGAALEYTKIWQFVINMDLSSNKLVGEIPVELTTRYALVGLNLSNNHLSGGIPDCIGDMKGLNSLDLSGNELSGQIPSSIAALNFLSYLNLSNNNLSGQIPTGNQLQTLLDPSIYAGNKDLCGDPLPKNCSNHEETTATSKSKYKGRDEPKKVWFYVDITCGFATGFWGVIVVLVMKKQWRHKLIMFAEETIDKIHVAVIVRVNKMKRGK